LWNESVVSGLIIFRRSPTTSGSNRPFSQQKKLKADGQQTDKKFSIGAKKSLSCSSFYSQANWLPQAFNLGIPQPTVAADSCLPTIAIPTEVGKSNQI